MASDDNYHQMPREDEFRTTELQDLHDDYEELRRKERMLYHEIRFLRTEREDWESWSDARRAHWEAERQHLQADSNATLNEILGMRAEARRVRREADRMLNQLDDIIDRVETRLDDLDAIASGVSDEVGQHESEDTEDWDDEDEREDAVELGGEDGQQEDEDDDQQDIPDAVRGSPVASTSPPSAYHSATHCSNAPSPSCSPLHQEGQTESPDHDPEHTLLSNSNSHQHRSQDIQESSNLQLAEHSSPLRLTTPVPAFPPLQPRSPPRPATTQSLPPSQPSHRRRRSSEGDLPEAKRAREY